MHLTGRQTFYRRHNMFDPAELKWTDSPAQEDGDSAPGIPWIGPLPEITPSPGGLPLPCTRIAELLPEDPPENLDWEWEFDAACADSGIDYNEAAVQELKAEGLLPADYDLDAQWTGNDTQRAWNEMILQRAESFGLPDKQCLLAKEWGWPRIESAAKRSPSYRRRDHPDRPYVNIRRALIALDQSLLAVHPNLSKRDYVTFWSSVQVRDYIRDFCRDHYSDVGRISPELWDTVSHIERFLASFVFGIGCYPSVESEPPATLPRSQETRDERFQAFARGNRISFNCMYRSASVSKSDGFNWRKGKVKDNSVMAQRIEDVLAGRRPIIRRESRPKTD